MNGFDQLTESEEAACAATLRPYKRRRKSLTIDPARNASEPTEPEDMGESRDRWVNWDQLAVGEDFWDTVEEVDAQRLGEIREQRQMEDIRRAHEARLEARQVRADTEEENPTGAHMQNKPAGHRDIRSARLAADIAAVVDRLDAGEEAAALCAEYGVASETLRRWAKREREDRLMREAV